jgi:hypothetical protein
LTLGTPGGTSATGFLAGGGAGASGAGLGAGVATAVGSSWYTQVYNGTQAATMGKAVLAGLAGVPNPALYMAPATLQGTQVKVVRLKLAGTRGKPTVWAECEIVDQKARENRSGLVTVGDLDQALRLGEVTSDEHLTREQAIAKLEEAKKLLDLQLYTQEQYDAEKAKYSKIILGE